MVCARAALLLSSARALIGGGLLHAIASLTRAGRLALLPLHTLLPLHALLPSDRDAKRHDCSLVDLAGSLEALSLLELNQRISRSGAEHTIRLADVEALLIQSDLQLP